ncbi:hypothetical protein KNLIENLN_00076 [Sinorhizobium phage NV1.1.1]|nr:hypothetical protein KNLIENLN_00076 [Sinorhizobium phage NV1.1.1]
MTRQEIIEELAVLTEPQRRIDQAIAELFRFRRETTNFQGQEGVPGRIVVTWYDPNGKEVGNVPRFTGNVDAAKSLLDLSFPGTAGGFSWHDGYAQAQIGGREPVTAFSVAAALCLATLKAVQL